MSAYIVDREHIVYLVKSCMNIDGFGWTFKNKYNMADYGTYFDNALRVANMLWIENMDSVCFRYPGSVDDPEGLPGPIGEDFIITENDLVFQFHRPFDPVQVLKACQCYAYQTCEHPDWKESEANAFIDALEQFYISRLPGYESAKWGAPRYLIND